MTGNKYITYETLDDGTVARIMLNRLRTPNAQHRGLLVELNEAMLAAEADDTVRVVILGGVGPIFSAGHDMGSKESLAEQAPGPDQHPTFQGYGATRLMLMWACDLIVAADDASFADVVGTRLGMCGVEYFAHPWEFGPRR